MTNTWLVAKDASMFGVGGSLVGFGLGAAAQWLDGGSDTSSIFLMGGVGALTGAIIGQLGGMMIVNQQQGGTGLLMTPMLGLSGSAGMMAYSKFRKGHSNVKTVIKYGVVGGIIGAPVGAGIDYLRNNV